MSKRYMPEFDLTGKVVLVTGACGLIGTEVCDALSQAGADVVISDVIPEEKIKKSADDLSCKHNVDNLGIYIDITDSESTDAAIAEIIKKYGKIDVLINNAAIDAKFDDRVGEIIHSRFENYPLENIKRSIDVNLLGTITLSQKVVKIMLEKRNGNIINVTSTYALVAPDQRLYLDDSTKEQTLYKPVDYIVSKSYIPGFTRYLATLYATEGIRVNTIVPHGVNNDHPKDFQRRFAEKSPMRRMCGTKELRGPFVFLASDSSSYMTGSMLVIDGGWSIW